MTVRLDWNTEGTRVVSTYVTYHARDLQFPESVAVSVLHSQSSKLLCYIKLTNLKISGNVGALTLSHRQKTPMSTALRT